MFTNTCCAFNAKTYVDVLIEKSQVALSLITIEPLYSTLTDIIHGVAVIHSNIIFRYTYTYICI